jgi:hypothetical protein
MSRKLINTNPWLRDPVQRERSVLKSVASSSAIEGIRAPFRDLATETVAFRKPRKSSEPRKKR